MNISYTFKLEIDDLPQTSALELIEEKIDGAIHDLEIDNLDAYEFVDDLREVGNAVATYVYQKLSFVSDYAGDGSQCTARFEVFDTEPNVVGKVEDFINELTIAKLYGIESVTLKIDHDGEIIFEIDHDYQTMTVLTGNILREDDEDNEDDEEVEEVEEDEEGNDFLGFLGAPSARPEKPSEPVEDERKQQQLAPYRALLKVVAEAFGVQPKDETLEV